MNEFTQGVEADVNGSSGLTLDVETLGAEALEERIAPSLFAVIGVGAAIGISGGCDCCCSSS